MFTDHGENEIDENEVRENVSSVQLSGAAKADKVIREGSRK